MLYLKVIITEKKGKILSSSHTEQVNVSRVKNHRTSKTTLFFAACLIAAVSFVAGTRQHQFEAFIGPFFGVKTSSETLDTVSLQNTYRALQANFDGKLDAQKLIDGANHGLVTAAGDKFTVYLNSDEAKEFNGDLNGDVGAGIGAEIGTRNNQPTITRVLDDNPAKAAGVQAGDVIVSINGQSAKGWTSDKAAATIRGDAGTTVKLTISRNAKSMNFSITRETINNPSVTSSVENGIGVLKISRFDEQTGVLARKAALNLKRQNVKGIILDLRSDGGGYLDAAVDVAGLWLDKKLVVSQKHDGKTIDEQYSDSNTVLSGMKTAILVNEGTASASEILSSALKDNGVGTLIGTKTYGKGSVQQVINLADGAVLKVTVAKWYTPKGNNINGKGLQPDTKVDLTEADANAGRDPQLDAAKKVLGVN